MGVGNCIFWTEIGSGFGERGGTPLPPIPSAWWNLYHAMRPSGSKGPQKKTVPFASELTGKSRGLYIFLGVSTFTRISVLALL